VLDAPGPVAQFGNAERPLFTPAHTNAPRPPKPPLFHRCIDSASSQRRTLYSRAFRFRLRISSTSALGGVSCINPFGALELCVSLSSSMVEARRKVVRGLSGPDSRAGGVSTSVGLSARWSPTPGQGCRSPGPLLPRLVTRLGSLTFPASDGNNFVCPSHPLLFNSARAYDQLGP